jgi:hypothetical protein
MVPLKKSEIIKFCNPDCNQLNIQLLNEDILYRDVYQLLKNHEGKTIQICDSILDRSECKRKGVLFFWQGGLIPGPAYVETLKVKDVSFDEIGNEIKFVMEFNKKSFVGIPFICTDVKGNISMNDKTNLTMKSVGAWCNWAGMGLFVLNMYISVDYIDVKKELIGGNYKLNGGGPMNGGGGTGHLLMNFVKYGDDVADRKEEKRPAY